jgi:hypothetical protein
MSTDYLFARPSLLRGIARVVDLCGVLDLGAYDTSATPEEADEKALLSDWQAVAGDFAAAFAETEHRVSEARRNAEAEES